MDTLIRSIASLLSLFSGVLVAGAPTPAQQACPDWHWIGVLNQQQSTCTAPPNSGWQASPLFEVAGVETAPALTRFCRFEDPDGDAPIAALQSMVGTRLVKLDRDCAVVAALGDPASLATIQWGTLAAELREQSGIEALAGRTLLGSGEVRLAVLDGNPTNANDPQTDLGTSPHGNALITIAENLLCPATIDCAVEVTSQLALTIVRVDPARRNPGDVDDTNGGHLASVGELAAAAHREVSDWRLQAKGDRLVMNISLGWDGTFGGNQSQVSQMPVPVQAMYAVLADASCRGALVFAAAGNRSGGIDAQAGPLLPGAWERRNAPTLAQCQSALGGSSALDPLTFSGSAYRPLLYAVSGIEGDGDMLDNARDGANARLVAYADHAVVESAARASGEPTATLTGSSVAAVLASSNAALAWSWQPALSAHQIVDLLYAAADGTSSALARNADFCLTHPATGLCKGGASAEMHRLSLCLTHFAANATTPAIADCAWDPAAPALTLDYSDFDRSAQVIDLDAFDRTAILPACNNALLVYHSARGIPANPCPHLNLPSLGSRPWVLPQPGSDLCPQCEDGGGVLEEHAVASKIDAERVLRMQISPRLVGNISDTVLLVGNQLYALDTGRPLLPGDRVLVRNFENVRADHDRALIAFAVDGSISALSTVLLSH